jgi:hypothetical protein
MLILKSQKFANTDQLVQFVNDNHINKESIVTVTQGQQSPAFDAYTIFYYSDSETEEKKHGFWG